MDNWQLLQFFEIDTCLGLIKTFFCMNMRPQLGKFIKNLLLSTWAITNNASSVSRVKCLSYKTMRLPYNGALFNNCRDLFIIYQNYWLNVRQSSHCSEQKGWNYWINSVVTSDIILPLITPMRFIPRTGVGPIPIFTDNSLEDSYLRWINCC
jgi:hypothetical protein